MTAPRKFQKQHNRENSLSVYQNPRSYLLEATKDREKPTRLCIDCAYKLSIANFAYQIP